MHNKIKILNISAIILFSPYLHAEVGVSTMEEMVVFGNRIEISGQDKTRTSQIVDKEELDELQVNSVAEAVKFIPNVTVAGGNVAGNQSINIRGLQGNKILQVVDGNRQNVQFDHRPSYFLDPSLISNIDVIKGPVSSLYGSGAIGGVVLENTITADDLVEVEGVGGQIKLGYQSNGNLLTTTTAIANKSDELDWLLAGSYQDSGVMEQGNGFKLHGTEAINKMGLAKFNWKFTDTQSIGVDYRISGYDGRPPVVGVSEPVSASDSLISRKSKDQNISLRYLYNPDNELLNTSATIYRNDTDIKEATPTHVGKDISDITTNGFSITNQSEIDKMKVFVGVDGYQDKLNTKRPAASQGRPVPPDGAKVSTIGGFVHANYKVVDNLELDAGVRYDTFKSKAEGFDDNHQDAWSPSVGVNWQATDWMLWSLRYDEAFRAANTAELFMDGTHFSMGPFTNVFIPNPDLKPEQAHNVELKGTFNFENLLGDDELTLIASAFRNKVKDFINLDVSVSTRAAMMACYMKTRSGVGCGGTSRSSNVDSAELTGFEVITKYRYQHLNTLLSYGQTHGKNEKTGDWLTNIPADKWIVQVDYGFWDIDTKVGTRAIFAQQQDRVPSSDNEGPYKAYQLVDFYASWEPTSKLEGLKVDFTIANAFDENYRTPWTQVYEPGRSIKVSAQYRF